MKRVVTWTKAFLVFVVLAVASPCFAGEIRAGATVQVKEDSLWFEDEAKLARWQALKKSGEAKALETYENEALSKRDAWRFTKPLAAKILSYDPATGRVHAEMTAEGRLQGTRWMLDAGAVGR